MMMKACHWMRKNSERRRVMDFRNENWKHRGLQEGWGQIASMTRRNTILLVAAPVDNDRRGTRKKKVVKEPRVLMRNERTGGAED